MTAAVGAVPSKWVTLGIVAIGSYLTASELEVVVTFPALIQDFNSTPSVIIWVQLVYLLVSASIIFTTGNLADALGLGRVYTLGFVVFIAGLAVSSLAQNPAQLIACRAFQAVGHAMLLSSDAALVMRAFPPAEQGRGLGLRAAVGGIGLTSGPFLGGILVQVLGWQSVFYTRIPLALLGFLLSWRYLRLSAPGRRVPGRFDIPGALFLFLSIGAFLLAVNQAGRVGWDKPIVWAAGLAALTLLPTLILIERRSVQPVLDLSLFRNRSFLAGQAVLALNYLAQGPVMYFSPFYFSGSLGMSSFGIGLMLATFSAARLVFSPLSGVLTDKIGSRFPTTLGLAFLALGVFLLSRLGSSGTIPLVALGMAMAGIGSALFEPPNTRQIIRSLPRQRWGTATASVSWGRQVSSSTGTALLGTVYQIRESAHRGALASQGLPAQVIEQRSIGAAFSDGLVLAMGFAVMGMLFSALRPVRQADESDGPA